VMNRVKQCSNSNGPMLAPDVFLGEDCASWSHADLSAEYKKTPGGCQQCQEGRPPLRSVLSSLPDTGNMLDHRSREDKQR
jgi:hypothetical protein